MPELRWILIIFGVILLAGIYAWGRRSNKQSAGSEDALVRVRPEPRLPSREMQSHAFDRQDAASELASEDPDEFMDADVPEDEPSITAHRSISAGSKSLGPAALDDDDFAAPASPRSAGYSREASPAHPGSVRPASDHPGSSADSIRPSSTRPGSIRPSSIRNARVEPTLDDDTLTEELPVHEQPTAAVEAPTLAMSDTPQPRRIERRKIIALRLAATSDRYAGQQLREALEAESLQYGKYNVFHRLHDDGVSIFSVASMVEPGTFDLEQMSTTRYPGATLFAQLPGPVAGVQALHELVACGKRLQQSLGGTLQDERGVPLTVHRIERLRQEIMDFENAPGRDPGRDSAQRQPLPPSSP